MQALTHTLVLGFSLLVGLLVYTLVYAFCHKVVIHHLVVARHVRRIEQVLRLATPSKQPTATDAMRQLTLHGLPKLLDKIHAEALVVGIPTAELVIILNVYARGKAYSWQVIPTGVGLILPTGVVQFEWG